MSSLLQDLRYSARALWHAPGFALVVILTLALGIGGNTAVFSVVRGVWLRPLGYPEEDRLLQVVGANLALNAHDLVMSVPEYEILRNNSRAFSDLGAYLEESYNLTGGAAPERVRATGATPNLLATLGVAPVLGRPFTAQEAEIDAEPVVLLSHSLWQRQFASDPAVLGRIVMLNNRPYTVIGVLPAWFEAAWGERYFGTTGVWMPFPEAVRREPARSVCLRAIGRLQPRRTLADARTDLANVTALLRAGERESDAGWTLEARPLIDALVDQPQRQALLALMGAVAFVLLIGCVNVAGLLLARGSTRVGELAVRAALGADRVRLVRHGLAECALLTAVGGAAGIALAAWGVTGLTALLPANFPRRGEIVLDTPVLLFAVGLSAVTCLLCGLGPALRCSGAALGPVLQAGPRTLSTNRRGGQRRDLLVVGQVTLAVALLACAGLMIRTFRELSAVDPGFDPEHVLTLRTELSWTSRQEWARFSGFYLRAVNEIRRLPGVIAAGGVTTMPMCDGGLCTGVEVEGQDPAEPRVQEASLLAITPGYLDAMRIPLRTGRDFTGDDQRNTPAVALVNEGFARRCWPRQDPLGMHITVGNQELTVVGVVGDVRYWGLDEEVGTQLYRPVTQDPRFCLRFIVRTAGDPAAAAGLVQQALWSIDPGQPVCSVRPLHEIVRANIGVRATLAGLLAALSGMSLLLTGVGIASVIAYTVARRTREIGIRIAFGATSGDILGFIGRRYAALTTIGLVAGTGLALLGARLLRSLLFAVSPYDPQALLAAVGLATVAVLLAGYLPARRATRVDPLVALRCE